MYDKSKKIALQVRLNENIHSEVKRIAEQELRSLNNQIEYFVYIGIQNYLNNHSDD